MKNNNIFDEITNSTNTVFDYAKKYNVKDRVKHIFMQYVYQNDKKPVVSEPLFFHSS